MSNYTSVDLAWAAGLVDAEGCIAIIRATDKKSPRYYATISVGNNDTRPLARLSELFGGTVKTRRKLYGTSKNHFSWWSRSSGPALDVIGAIAPYLVTKRVEAELTLQMRHLAIGRGKRPTHAQREQAQSLYEMVGREKRNRFAQTSLELSGVSDAERLAWAGGFFDGEGSISIAQGTFAADRERVSYFPQIEIGHVDPRPLMLFLTLFGGTTRLCQARGRGRQPITHYRLRGTASLSAIAAMKPWLISKAEQADKFLQFINLLSATRNVRLTKENETARASLKHGLAALKSAKGVKRGF